jgi:protein disulfide-isomerase A6
MSTNKHLGKVTRYLAGQVMLALALARAARAAYVELSPRNFWRYVGGDRPAVVNFYRAGCGKCGRVAGPYSEASTLFNGVVFGGVNCAVEDDLCRGFNLADTPRILLYAPGNRTGAAYTGPRTVAGFVAHVEQETGQRALPSQTRKLTEFSPSAFERAFAPGKCGLALFYESEFVDFKHLLPQFGYLTFVYEPDPTVVIGVVNCSKHADFCQARRAVRNPREGDEPLSIIQIYSRDTWSVYEEAYQMDTWIATVNEECNVGRKVDGLLIDEAGRIPQADEIARDFVEALNKQPLVEKLKAIEGAELYLKVIERFTAGGLDQLKKDVDSMKRNLDERKGSQAVLDGMKRRYNVYQQFIPRDIPSDQQAFL